MKVQGKDKKQRNREGAVTAESKGNDKVNVLYNQEKFAHLFKCLWSTYCLLVTELGPGI